MPWWSRGKQEKTGFPSHPGTKRIPTPPPTPRKCFIIRFGRDEGVGVFATGRRVIAKGKSPPSSLRRKLRNAEDLKKWLPRSHAHWKLCNFPAGLHLLRAALGLCLTAAVTNRCVPGSGVPPPSFVSPQNTGLSMVAELVSAPASGAAPSAFMGRTLWLSRLCQEALPLEEPQCMLSSGD